MNIEVNKKAPAFYETKILIHAPAEKVYKILSSINNWPKWQNEVTEAFLNRKAVPGKTLVWKANGIKIKSQIHTATSPTELG